MDSRIREIRHILDALARVDNADNDTKEIVYDRELAKVKELDRENIIYAIKEAVGENTRRKRFSPFVFSELYEVSGIEEVFTELLESADDLGRSDIIQTIGLRKMRKLVGVLNRHFYRETDDFCKNMTLNALGNIADESSLPIYVELMEKDDHEYEWSILWASHNFVRPEFKNYLSLVFENELTKTSNKVMAAWGLAKLGEKRCYDYLVSMLDDPEIRTASSFDPGHSMRAAQALADIHGWDFEWDKNSVKIVKSKVAVERHLSEI